MTDQIVGQLLERGLPGVVILLLIMGCVRLYRDLQAEREKHKAEMLAFEQRYIQKVETWADKNMELTKSLHGLVESLERRVGGGRR